MLTILNAETGEPVDAMRGISTTGLSEDGRFVYLRKLSGDVVKSDSSGKELWVFYFFFLPNIEPRPDLALSPRWRTFNWPRMACHAI